jgi:apolipoprotein N-acyltransferase
LRLPVSALVVIVAGLLHAASISTPWDRQPAGWLQLIALGLLAWQLDRSARPMHAGVLTWIFSTAWLSGTFWWMFVAMHTYAGLAAWLAAFAVVALAAVLSLYYGISGAMFRALAPRSKWSAGVLFAALWLLAELARGVWFTGFGWGAAGYAHIGALARSAQYIGAYGVTALVALVAYLISAWLQQPRTTSRLGLAGLAALIAAVMAWAPGDFTRAGASLKVALLQGNIAQDEKFQAGTGVVDSLRWYGDQLNASTAALVVAPETAIPLLPQQLPDGYWTALQQRFTTGTQAALVGIPLGDPKAGYTNSVVGFKPGAATASVTADRLVYRYDKHHLVPFGEFIPPMFRWFTEMMNIPLGDFNRGDIGQASFEWQGQRLAPNVCYEDLFGEELGARFIDPASAPTIFVNLSNIGWFGNTVAIDQHLNISRMRALEFGRPFIRATNTGDTAIIDYTGRVIQSLPRFTRGVLLGQVQGRNGVTPYAWWVSRFGLWPLWLLASAIVLMAFARRLGSGPQPLPGKRRRAP